MHSLTALKKIYATAPEIYQNISAHQTDRQQVYIYKNLFA